MRCLLIKTLPPDWCLPVSAMQGPIWNWTCNLLYITFTGTVQFNSMIVFHKQVEYGIYAFCFLQFIFCISKKNQPEKRHIIPFFLKHHFVISFYNRAQGKKSSQFRTFNQI